MEMPTLRGWAVGVWRRADDRSSSLELTNASIVELVCIASERVEWSARVDERITCILDEFLTFVRGKEDEDRLLVRFRSLHIGLISLDY